MRNLSFALTTEQMRDRTKTVTRRKGTWWSTVLKPGDLVCAVEKSQGIPKGGLVRLGVIRIVSVRVEPLDAVTWTPWETQREECAHEGFPEFKDWWQFVGMFLRHMGGAPDHLVTRIEFEFTDLPVPGGGA